MVMPVTGICNYECSEEMYVAIIIIFYMSFFFFEANFVFFKTIGKQDLGHHHNTEQQ